MNLTEMAPRVALQIAEPKHTRSYTPVGNYALLNTMQHYIEEADLQIVSADMQLAAHGQQFMGTVKVKHPDIADPDLGMSLGFRNSYNKSFAVGFGAGAEVFVCSNGMFVADVKAVRKHTTEVWRDVNNILGTQVRDMKNNFDALVTDMRVLKTNYLSPQEVQEIVWQLWVEEKILTGAQMNILKKEMFFSENFQMYDPKNHFDRPNVPAWDMYNNVTEALKRSHPSKYFKDHEKLHSLMMSYTN